MTGSVLVRSRRVRVLSERAGQVALVVAALLDTVWVVVFVVPTGLRWPWLSFSDVEADHRPWAWLFRTAFCGADLLVATVGSVQAASGGHAFRSNRWTRIGWAVLAVFGVASSVDDLVAMTCVPGVDPNCRLGGSPAGQPLVDQLHSAFSTIAVLAVLGSMIAVTLAGRGPSRGWAPRLAPAWLVCELGSALGVVACYFTGGPMGVPQSFELVTEATWLVLLSHHLGSTARLRRFGPGFPVTRVAERSGLSTRRSAWRVCRWPSGGASPRSNGTSVPTSDWPRSCRRGSTSTTSGRRDGGAGIPG